VAIFATTASICSEVEQQYVHITDTKPLPRWQFLLGKWLGIMVMCTAVLYVMAAGAYLLVREMAKPPDYTRMKAAEAAQARDERAQVANEVLVARKSVTAPLPDVTAEVEAAVERARRDGKPPPFLHSFRNTERETALSKKLSVAPGAMHRWDFAGLEPMEEGYVHVRFKAHARGQTGIYGRWIAARRQMVQAEDAPEGKLEEQLVLVGLPIMAPPSGWANSTTHEFQLPGSYIAKDGTLTLLFQNANPQVQMNTSVTFDVDDVVEVLQRKEGFFPNYYRALLIILLHVGLLAALGLMAGSLFSFPVAALVVSSLFIGGLIGPWFAQFTTPNLYVNLNTVTEQLDRIWRAFAAVVLALMPNFGSFSPLGALVNGRMVTWGQVSMAGSVLFVVKGGVALLIGMYFYARRELARVIV